MIYNNNLELIKLNNHISYITSTDVPLSANVVLVNGNDHVWMFDVGNHPDIPEIVNEFNRDGKKVNAVLSHFHPDHIGNIQKIKFDKVYQGRLTFKHTGMGDITESDIYIDDGGVRLHIFPLPSSHSKGSLAMEADETYCFLGDGIYDMERLEEKVYNAGLLKEEINVLNTVKADNFCLSHREPFITPKEIVIRHLEKIYGRRSKNEAYIKDC